METTQAMLNVREQVLLSGFTTLGLGGPARRFVEAGADQEIIAEVRAADERGEPLLVLGGGSNLVIADDGFAGTVIRVATTGIRRTAGITDGGPEADVAVTVAAGEEWDTVVASCVSAEIAGLECLSGIPGRAGAVPIQNVGAYGQEVAETITTVRAYDRARREVVELPAADCGFGYRTSAFKRGMVAPAVTGRYVVLGVTFRLSPGRLSRPVRYTELAKSLGVAEGGRAPLADVRTAVLALRRGKGMVLDPGDPDSRSAGSFFTNPILDTAQFAALRQAVDRHCGPDVGIPTFPAGPGQVKVPAAWLIGQAGFRKGYEGPASSPGAGRPRPAGTARISSKHTLALVNAGGASTAAVVRLAREIRDRVRDAFGVELAGEPVLVGVSL
jgi:UDP-N-acetylmuramate dehydrogenase